VLAGEAPSTAARTLGDEIDDRKSVRSRRSLGPTLVVDNNFRK
jgi:hypothetical protein